MTIQHLHPTRGRHSEKGAEPHLISPRDSASTGAPGAVTQPAAGRVGGLSPRRLGVIGLALVLISAMDSIRNLPTTATFGWSAIFFYGLAVIAYLVPVALCSAELATSVGGGVYRWVREAFGSRWGFLAVWCDWSENIVWFPTVLVFLATTLAYVINPDLSQNKAFLVPVMLVIFWAVTLSSLVGSLKSARWTGVGVIVGTALPTLAIIGLGLWWVGSGKKSEIPFHASAVLPPWHGLASLVYAASIVVAFAGMEIGGFYSHVTRNVKRTFPSAVLVAAATVATLSILGSVAIAMVVPHDKIELAGGIMQAVQIFFTKLGIEFLMKPFGVLVIIGVLCGLASWSTGPAEGMRRVAADGHLRPWWGRTNRRGAAYVGADPASHSRFASGPDAGLRQQHQHLLLDADRARRPNLPHNVPAHVRGGCAVASYPAECPPPLQDPGWQAGTHFRRRRWDRGCALRLRSRIHPGDPFVGWWHCDLRRRDGIRPDPYRRDAVPPTPRTLASGRYQS